MILQQVLLHRWGRIAERVLLRFSPTYAILPLHDSFIIHQGLEAIRRIEQVNPKLNAVVTQMYDVGRKAAHDGPNEGPFAGVPILLKGPDVCVCRGSDE